MWLYPAGKRGTNALTYYYELCTGRHSAMTSPGTCQTSNLWAGGRVVGRRCDDAVMARRSGTAAVIRISRMAHLASAFLALCLLIVVPVLGPAGLGLLVIPLLLSLAVERLQTVADEDGVTARGLLSSRTLAWSQIEGLKFTGGRWARACSADGAELRLPAVTFATVPILTGASGGRVPNPYRR